MPVIARALLPVALFGLLSSSPSAGLATESGDPPLCFEDVNGRLEERPCPAQPGGARTTPGSSPTPAKKPGSSPAPAKKTDPSSARPTDSATMHDRLKSIALGKDEARSMEAFEALVAEGEAALPGVIAVYQDREADPRVRWVAGRALGRISSPRSTDVLIAGLKDAQPMARVAAARALGDAGERRAVPALVEALRDPGALVRAAALDSLGILGSSTEAKAVAAELTAAHNFVRGQGLFVRAHAAAALGRLGGREAVAALIGVVDDKDPDTRAAAREGLLRLSGLTAPPPGQGSEKARWEAWWKAKGALE